MSVAKKAVQGTAYVAATGYFTQVYTFVTSIILARLLEPEHFGIISLATVIFSFISRLRLFGFNYILISSQKLNNRIISTHFLLQAGLTILTIVTVVIIRPVLTAFYDSQVINVLLIIAVLALFDAEGLASTPDALLSKELRFKERSVLTISVQTSSPVVAIILAFLGFGVWALVAGQVWQILLTFVGVWVLCPWKPWHGLHFDKATASEFWHQGRHLWMSGLATFVVFSYDDFLVGSWDGVKSLGFYNRAYNLSKRPMSVISSVLQVAFPTYSKAKNDPAKLSFAYSTVLNVVALVAFPMAVFLAISAREIIVLLIGEKWLPAVPLLQLLLVYSLLRPISDTAFSLPIALGQPEILTKIGVLQLGLMLILCTLFTYYWGAAGAAISADIVVLAGVLMVSKYFIRDRLTINYKQIFVPPVVGLVFATGAVFSVLFFLPATNLINVFLVKATIFGSVYLLLLWTIDRERLVNQMNQIFKLLKR